jgi:TrmH family RNA methyltransferase
MAKAETLASLKNPLLKEVRRAIARGTLTASGYAIAETFHLLEEALRSDRVVGVVLAAESVRTAVETHVKGLRSTKVYVLADELFAHLPATESAQGVLALVKPPAWTLDHLFRGLSLVVVLDGLQDPGNAGAIIRTAEAFGATGILATKGTVNVWNPKVIRGSAGSVFRLPMVAGVEAALVQTALRQRGVQVYATAAHGGQALHETKLTGKCAVVIGSEGHGVSSELREGSTALHIRTARVESLNASVAAGVVLYEAHRQRMRS